MRNWLEEFEEGDVDAVLDTISKASDIDDIDGCIPLYIACAGGHLNIVQICIAAGAYVNITTDNRDTPLHCASHYGYPEIVKFLIKQGAIVNYFNRDYVTPLHVACQYGHSEVLKVLLEAGALINEIPEACDEDGPLHMACQKGYSEVVNILLEAGALINEENEQCNTPLHFASQKGRLGIVKVLIANKANFLYKNYYGKTPLDVAKTDAIKQYIMNHPWYRSRSLLVTRPHADHETNKEHKLKPLGEIITATPGSASDPSSQDNVLFQIKMKVASFL